MINKLLNESPNIKVGLVTFESNVVIYGDCLEEKKIIKEVNDENKIKSFGDEYSYLISNPISKESLYLIHVDGDSTIAYGTSPISSRHF